MSPLNFVNQLFLFFFLSVGFFALTLKFFFFSLNIFHPICATSLICQTFDSPTPIYIATKNNARKNQLIIESSC